MEELMQAGSKFSLDPLERRGGRHLCKQHLQASSKLCEAQHEHRMQHVLIPQALVSLPFPQATVVCS